MTAWILGGTALGAAAFLTAVRTGRGWVLAAGYGIGVAATALGAVAVVYANRVEGMGGLPYAVAAGALLWFVLVPLVLGVGYLEWSRRRGVVGTAPGSKTGRVGTSSSRTEAELGPEGSAHLLDALGGARGVGMRAGFILVLVAWGRLIIGSTGVLALPMFLFLGWMAGGRWERTTRHSPHRFAHSLAPWILFFPWFVSLLLALG